MTSDILLGEQGKPWVRTEIDLVVSAYFSMLAAELRGERPVKAAAVRELGLVIPARSRTSIERKMQNISAVLDDLGLAWIDGYKPLGNLQRDLRTAVIEDLERGHRIGEALADYGDNVLPAPMPTQLATADVLVDPPSIGARKSRNINVTVGPRGALQDFKNRKLGRNGEKWVIGIEREQLYRAGRSDLADRIEWTSQDIGDGTGYDIASFRVDGSPLLIEVKTTNLGVRTPFHITRWEVEVSRQQAEHWALYRVFDFRSDPRVYRLDGSVDESARLEPSVFQGLPR